MGSSVVLNASFPCLSTASAHVHATAELCVLSGLHPGTPSPLSFWQNSTNGLLLATDEHRSYVLLCVCSCTAHNSAFHLGARGGEGAEACMEPAPAQTYRDTC